MADKEGHQPRETCGALSTSPSFPQHQNTSKKQPKHPNVADNATEFYAHNGSKLDHSNIDIPPERITINQLLSDKNLGDGVTLGGDSEKLPATLLAQEKPKQYRIGDLLAKGGMGKILNAKDLNCRREVAMKVIGDSKRTADDHLIRFIIEAQITAQLQHPSIVPVYELSVDANGDVFYTMKLVHGYTLVEILDKLRNSDSEFLEKYSLVRLLNIFLRVCEAVAYAHSKCVIHRDLKPENIMIGDFGEVLLMDWGLAKIIKGNSSDSTKDPKKNINFDGIESILMENQRKDMIKTLHGQIMGTPGFMPPEQALGNINDVDERSDVYALGGILYNILTLQKTVNETNIRKIINQIVKGNFKPPIEFNKDYIFSHCPDGKIPEVLSAISMKAMQGSPGDRYQSVPEIQNDIEKYLGGFATTVEDNSFFYLLKLMIKRNRKEFLSGTIVLFVILTLTLGFVLKIVEAKNLAEHNLNRFLQEQSVRKDVSKRLLTQAIEKLKEFNPQQSNFFHEISLIGNEFALNLANNRQLTNISPLKGIPLVKLNLANTSIDSLNALKGTPLRWISIANTNVRDISPLAESKLFYLDVSNSTVANLHELEHLNISYLAIAGIPKTDLKILQKFPLKNLTIDNRQMIYFDILNNLQLKELRVNAANKSTIKRLAKIPLQSLILQGRNVNDLSGLNGMKIRSLSLISTRVKNLNDIKNLPLKKLIIHEGLMRDIKSLKHLLNLEELHLEKCYFITDISALAECKGLKRLLIPPHITSNLKFLDQLPNLVVLANNSLDFNEGQTVDEFRYKMISDSAELP